MSFELLFRPQRGVFNESMALVEKLTPENTLHCIMHRAGFGAHPLLLSVFQYSPVPDYRNGWPLWIVVRGSTLATHITKAHHVMGFTNGPVSEELIGNVELVIDDVEIRDYLLPTEIAKFDKTVK